MNNHTTLVLAMLATSALALAAPPPILSHQGRILQNGANFTGTGHFKAVLVDGGSETATATARPNGGVITAITVTYPGSGYGAVPRVTITDPEGSGANPLAVLTNGSVTAINLFGGGGGYSANPTVTIEPPAPPLIQTLWSNDETGSNGSEPTQAFSVPVFKGLYSVALGDTSLPGMPQSIDPAIFALNADVRLRLWFNASGNAGSFQRLRPDQPILSTGFALAAATAEQIPSGSPLNDLSIGTANGGNDDTIYFDFGTSEFFNWDNSEDQFEISNDLTLAGILQVGGTGSNPLFNRLGTAPTTHQAVMTSADDLHISGDLEVDGQIFVDGTLALPAESVGAFQIVDGSIGPPEVAQDYLRADFGDTFTGAALGIGATSYLNMFNGSTIRFDNDAAKELGWDDTDDQLEFTHNFGVQGVLSAGVLQANATGPAQVYSRIGNAVSGGAVDDPNDLLVSDELEVLGRIRGAGNLDVSGTLGMRVNEVIRFGVGQPIETGEITFVFPGRRFEFSKGHVRWGLDYRQGQNLRREPRPDREGRS